MKVIIECENGKTKTAEKIKKITIGNKMVDFEDKSDSFFLYYTDFISIKIEEDN